MSDEWPKSVDRDVQTDGAGTERTGVPAVDRVLAEVESVSTLPVAEHVAVFDRAHVELRRALDADPSPRAPAPPAPVATASGPGHAVDRAERQ